jgi:hypothetical protein
MTGQGREGLVTVLEDLQEAVEETSCAALDYWVTEADVTGLEGRAWQVASRDRWPLAGLQRAVLDIAAQHHADCDLEDCRTCASIRHGLASTLAALRVLAVKEEATRELPRPRQRRHLARRSA